MSQGVIELYFLAQEHKKKYEIQKNITLEDLRQVITVRYLNVYSQVERLPFGF